MIDFKQQENGDLDLSTGDIIWTEPTTEHKKDILLSSQGDFTEFPLIGVGIADYLNGDDQGMLLRDISRQMQSDGINVKQVTLINGEIIINGEYEDNNS